MNKSDIKYLIERLESQAEEIGKLRVQIEELQKDKKILMDLPRPEPIKLVSLDVAAKDEAFQSALDQIIADRKDNKTKKSHISPIVVAIKRLRELTGCDLKTGKNFIENLISAKKDFISIDTAKMDPEF